MSQSCRIEPAKVFSQLKRGDDFPLTYSVPDTYGGSIQTVESTITNNRDFSFDFTVTAQGLISGRYYWTIVATGAQTALWPLQTLRMDIKKTYNTGAPQHTETVFLPVVQGETP